MAKQPHRRRGLRRWVGYVFSFFLGALLGLAGYIYLTRERAFSPEDFSQKVFLVDQIIQSQLYEIGLQKKNILLHQTSLKKEGGLVWKQSSLKVRVLPSLLLFPDRRKPEAKPFCTRETRFDSVLPKIGIPPVGGQGFGPSYPSAYLCLLHSILSENGSSPQDCHCD